ISRSRPRSSWSARRAWLSGPRARHSTRRRRGSRRIAATVSGRWSMPPPRRSKPRSISRIRAATFSSSAHRAKPRHQARKGRSMADLYPYPRFSIAERDRRWAEVRARMRAAKLDVIVVPNNTGHSTDFQSNSRYLTHVGGGGDADIAVVFPLEGTVTAIATTATARWPVVQEWTSDVREARRRYGKVAAERLKELGIDKGRIGVTG